MVWYMASLISEAEAPLVLPLLPLLGFAELLSNF